MSENYYDLSAGNRVGSAMVAMRSVGAAAGIVIGIMKYSHTAVVGALSATAIEVAGPYILHTNRIQKLYL
jgi:hypothetical protein